MHIHHGVFRMLRRFTVAMATVVMASVLLAVTALAAGTSMTLTFVRHGESQANYDGVIDTKVPGPNLTATGVAQAQAVANALQGNNYDGVYASDMVRTQQTAAPLLALLAANGDPQSLVVLPGLHEIDAGIFEGSSEDGGLGRIGYVVPPALWVLGARFAPLPGSSDADGNAFDERVDGAVQAIYDSGDHNAVAFAHGATIMFWVLMNVDNPDLGLLLTHQLDNAESVVITGNPSDGWTLTNWAGVTVDQTPSFATKQFVNFRDWVTGPQTSLYELSKALRTGNLSKIAAAIGNGLVNLVVSTVKFGTAVVNDIGDLVRGALPAAAAPANVTALRARVPAAAGVVTTTDGPIPTEDIAPARSQAAVRTAAAGDVTVAAEPKSAEPIVAEPGQPSAEPEKVETQQESPVETKLTETAPVETKVAEITDTTETTDVEHDTTSADQESTTGRKDSGLRSVSADSDTSTTAPTHTSATTGGGTGASGTAHQDAA